jgi:glutamate-1-semialdehyde 2,1-aminomutase
MNHEQSKALFHRAKQVMPGGVSSPVRAFTSVGGQPIYFKRAYGSHFQDVDGNDYIDFCMSWGPLVLGHAHPLVIDAVRRAAVEGLSFGACCSKEIELSELILRAFPTMEQVRFVSSGTEAVMTAIRLARGATARAKVLKFEGGYHGHSDSMLVKAGSGLVTLGTSSSLGVPSSLASETIVCPLDSEAALESIFKKYGPELAAVVVEPMPGNNGLLEQRPEWLHTLRRLCTEAGTLLIFDEVISGFRCQFGGYGDAQGVQADLITLGKVIGGGMPVGAITGPRHLMEQLAPIGGVYQAGTLSGNPVSLAAGIATLKLLEDGKIYDKMERLGQFLDAALEAKRETCPWLRWRRVGSLIWFHLVDKEIPRDANSIDPNAIAKLDKMHSGLLQRGLYLAPSSYELSFLSAAHTESDITALVEGIATVGNTV